MAFESSNKTYPCAECKLPFKAMKMITSKRDEHSVDEPQTVQEAIGINNATGLKFMRICLDCELKQRIKEVRTKSSEPKWIEFLASNTEYAA